MNMLKVILDYDRHHTLNDEGQFQVKYDKRQTHTKKQALEKLTITHNDMLSELASDNMKNGSHSTMDNYYLNSISHHYHYE